MAVCVVFAIALKKSLERFKKKWDDINSYPSVQLTVSSQAKTANFLNEAEDN